MSSGGSEAQEAEAGAAGHEAILLETRRLVKTFPGVRALDDVSIDVRRGEILGLVGENGAGKSTLTKILAGQYQPDAGEVSVGRRARQPRLPRACRAARDRDGAPGALARARL